MLQMDRIRLFVFVCILLQIGGANSRTMPYSHFSCANWDSYTLQNFVNMASGGSTIGEDGRRCKLKQGGSSAFCRWYVHYDLDGFNKWQGLSFGGVPGAGSGCCSSRRRCSTLYGAAAWLKSQHKNLCCTPPGHVGRCASVTFVNRETWDAISPRSNESLNTNLDYYIIHHTTGEKCSTDCARRVKSIQNSHMIYDHRWDDIGYNFLIGGDNKVYVGRGWDNQGAHAYGYNDRSIGISIIGNYEREEPPSDVMNTLIALMRCGVELGKVKEKFNACGHQDVASTLCPGNDLYALVEGWGRCNH